MSHDQMKGLRPQSGPQESFMSTSADIAIYGGSAGGGYDSVRHARGSLGRYLDFYNCRRPHSSIGARTPEQAYLDHLTQRMAA